MPRINRIRIINFSYNNNAREIVDETFDFYDGENVLLNLSNGGGKSVLVQLMMQPVLPDLKVQRRKMVDYIKQSTSPVFVILEWVLDNPTIKDYLMTGIAIAPKSAMQSEDSNKINYFTFSSHYDQASEFDISSVPFARKEGGQLVILPFERAREAVKKLAGAHREMFYYGREDGADYRKLLLNFGISQEEWRNIIAKMNNDEGGIDELFERCNTSDSIFNEWIIKNIEKAQLAGEAGGMEIEELLAGLVSDTMKNEEYIKAQKIISGYMDKHHRLEDGLEGVCRSLEELGRAEKELSGMYQALNKRVQEAEAELSELELGQAELEAEQQHIRMEEASEQYYETEIHRREMTALTEEKKQKQEEISHLLKAGRFLLECIQAAKIREECQRIKGKIDGIKGKIDAEKGDVKAKERMDNLAYSMSVWCEKRCDDLRSHELKLEEQLEDLVGFQRELSELETEKEKQQNQLNHQAGIFKAEITRFERYELGICKELEVSFLRNILKELDAEGVKKFSSSLKSQAANEEGRLDLLEDRQEQISIRLTELSGLLLENSKSTYEAEHSSKLLDAEWEAWAGWAKRGDELLLKYEIQSSFLYENERVKEALEEKIRQQEGQKYELLLDDKQIADMLHGIEHHRVYMPEILLKLVEKQDIACQTGEAYLGNLDETKRGLQLRKNPLLPFGLLVREKDKKRLEEISFGECFLRQVIPVFTYEQLDYEYLTEHQMVDLGHQVGIISSYEERIFGDEPRKEYVKQLHANKEELWELIHHREEELGQLRETAAFFHEIPYDKHSEEQLEGRLEHLRNRLDMLAQKKKDGEWEQEGLKQENMQNQAMRENAEDALKKIKNKQQNLEVYLEENEEYQEHYRQLCKAEEELLSTEKEVRDISQKLTNKRKEEVEIRETKFRVNHQLEQERQVAACYKDAKSGVLLLDPFSSMEQEYKQLTERLNDSLNTLTNNLEEQNKEYAKRKEELSELTVREEDYENLVFDHKEAAAKKAEIKGLEDEEKNCYQELSRLQHQLGDAKARYDSAGLRLRELGMSEPLPLTEIKQDYETRRKDANTHLNRLANQKREIGELRSACRGIAGRIEDMEVPLVPYPGYELEENRKEQFSRLKEGLKQAKVSAALTRKGCGSLYRNVSLEYKGRNQCVTDILESLENLHLEDGTLSYEAVYFSMEEFIKKRESLIKLLDFYDGQLESIVHTKNQIVDQCISYARMIYEDVKLIARKSRVQLSGKSRPVQMLKVGIPEELDSQVRLRMTQHIDESLRILTELGKSEEISEKKWKEKLSLFMSSRELFNQLIGTNKIPVYVYKIDLSDKGSGLKRWEDAMIQNSGGEKVVAFFTMISTLISYIRDVTGQGTGGDSGQQSKVIIMDNPFGRTSSEHLLKAIMDIARTFKIQLICLSDLNQSSITNRFSLIYQLSIRKRMYSDKEVLKSESVRMNKVGLVKNERLEHAGIYEMDGQKNMWEFMSEV